MRLLRQGATGSGVVLWQNFLRGQGQQLVADGAFGPRTDAETRIFQRQQSLRADGIVGARTWGKALGVGLGGVLEDDDEDGADYPPRPSNLAPYMSNAERAAVFGTFAYEAAPKPGNPEHIRVTDDWAKKNIVTIKLSDTGPQSRSVHLHRDVADAFAAMFSSWQAAALMHKILSWNGSYNARFIRGSKTTLSSHAWGTAIDVNAPQNALGTVPALAHERGSVRDLVAIANEHGIWWGGHYRTRLDGMHFESGKRT